MSLSVSAVKNLMATLGVKVDDLFSAEEVKVFLIKTVAKHGFVISDVFDEKAQNLFIEEWFKHNLDNLEKVFSAQAQKTFVSNWIKSYPESLVELLSDEDEQLKNVDTCAAEMSQTKNGSENNAAEQRPPAPTKAQEPKNAHAEDLKFIWDGNYQYVRQNGKIIGVVINTGTRRFIVMHDYDQDNLSKDEAQKRAYSRPTVKGKHWRLLTDADCQAMCRFLRTGGGSSDASLVTLMIKLGGNFVHEDHLTTDYYGQQKYKVKYAVDLD